LRELLFEKNSGVLSSTVVSVIWVIFVCFTQVLALFSIIDYYFQQIYAGINILSQISPINQRFYRLCEKGSLAVEAPTLSV
jgi:hypothetical protein